MANNLSEKTKPNSGATREKPGRKPKICDISKISGVISEMGKVYREMRTRKIDDDHGKSLVVVLKEMRGAYESMEIVERLNEIERRLIAGANGRVIPGDWEPGHAATIPAIARQ